MVGTDRSNILGIADRLDNFPLPMEDDRNLVKNSVLKWASGVPANDIRKYDATDVAVMLASSGMHDSFFNTNWKFPIITLSEYYFSGNVSFGIE